MYYHVSSAIAHAIAELRLTFLKVLGFGVMHTIVPLLPIPSWYGMIPPSLDKYKLL